MATVLIATENRADVDMAKQMLAGIGWDGVSLAEAGISGVELVEQGENFEEQAILDASAYYWESGMITLLLASELQHDQHSDSHRESKSIWCIVNKQGCPFVHATAHPLSGGLVDDDGQSGTPVNHDAYEAQIVERNVAEFRAWAAREDMFR